MSESKNLIKSAIESLEKNDATAMRKAVIEALLSKVQSRLDEKEQELSRNFFGKKDSEES
jgi:hypothetical protein